MEAKENNLPYLSCANRLIDTHCHLDMAAYRDDLAQVLDRAAQNHIEKIVTIGIDLASSRDAISLAQRHERLWATIGIHPHDVDNLADCDYTELEQLYLDHARHIVGFGEIGLDYAKRYSDPSRQREHFKRQLDLAHDLRLPIVVHNRNANEDTLSFLRQAKPLDCGGIMHCFSGDLTFAQQVIDLGMVISIPGVVTFKNAAVLQEVARKVPLASIVLETDGPFLAPHPFRGKRNEPSYLVLIAQKIADLRQLNIDEVAEQTTDNAEKLFKFSRIQP